MTLQNVAIVDLPRGCEDFDGTDTPPTHTSSLAPLAVMTSYLHAWSEKRMAQPCTVLVGHDAFFSLMLFPIATPPFNLLPPDAKRPLQGFLRMCWPTNGVAVKLHSDGSFPNSEVSE